MTNIKRYRDESDGKLREDRITEVSQPDGSKLKVTEIWEEKVPMTMKSKISSKIKEVPVEVTVEDFENGNVVNTHTDVMPEESLNLINGKKEVNMHDLKEQIGDLIEEVSNLKSDKILHDCCDSEVNSHHNDIAMRMAEKWDHSKKDVTVKDNGVSDVLMWIGIVISSLVLVYNIR